MEQQKQKRENGGYLFKNVDKRTDKQPDYRGKATLGGKEWLVSGWTRVKDGSEMISFSFTDPATLPQRESGAQGGAGARQAGGAASGPFAKPQGGAPAQSAPSKAFQPQASKAAGGATYDDLEDLDNLFNGLDDQH